MSSAHLSKQDNFYQSLILRLMEPMDAGFLELGLPAGEKIHFGKKESEIHARVDVRDDRFFKACVLHGDIGFGESYVDGYWDTDDIVGVISWMILNVEKHPLLMGSKPKPSRLHFFKLLNRFRHRLNSNNPTRVKKNIFSHYDLGNEFFQTFLDSGMTYSCAYFSKLTEESTGDAQEAKNARLCQKLRIKSADHVLEIGGGWGGFAIHAAKHFGCQVTTITISEAQCQYARERVRAENLSDKIDVELVDYRHVKGEFDKIVSIEMIEAVGHEYLKTYFEQCHRLLKKEGLLGLQMILSPDHRYESFKKGVDWIQKHIFPGGFLPSLLAIQEAINKTGDLGLYDYEDLTPHYVKTLHAWRKNFNAHLQKVKLLGFDERFIRKWNYYLSYCEAAFKMRNIHVVQAVFTRPNNHSL